MFQATNGHSLHLIEVYRSFDDDFITVDSIV